MSLNGTNKVAADNELCRAGRGIGLRISLLVGTAAAGLLASWTGAQATTWYVSASAAARGNGLSVQTAFKNLQNAANATRPGDTVLVLNGTYRVPCTGCDVLDISTSGTAAAPITYAAYPGATPVINFSNGWNGVSIDASYITLRGFQVVGGANNVTAAYALAHAADLDNYLTSADAIMVGDELTPGTLPTHVTVAGNVVSYAPGGGIDVNHADYVIVAGNQVSNCAFWSPYGESGISVYQSRDSDTYTGIKNYVVGNVTHGNYEYVPFYFGGVSSDGDGIIVDDNRNAFANNVAYNGRTYVANNLTYSNGGGGISIYSSQHVDIVANTAYKNNLALAIGGEIPINTASDINLSDNIMYAQSNGPLLRFYNTDATVVEDFNLLFSTTLQTSLGTSRVGPHDRMSDPKFAQSVAAFFSLTSASPAIGVATPTSEPSSDIVGTPRPSSMGWDVGAYEFNPAQPQAQGHAKLGKH